MPEISRFFGIVIQMFYDDHAPPHFHVRYAGQRALAAMMEDWNLARAEAGLKAIAPLE
jgi:hypothetical protein